MYHRPRSERSGLSTSLGRGDPPHGPNPPALPPTSALPLRGPELRPRTGSKGRVRWRGTFLLPVRVTRGHLGDLTDTTSTGLQTSRAPRFARARRAFAFAMFSDTSSRWTVATGTRHVSARRRPEQLECWCGGGGKGPEAVGSKQVVPSAERSLQGGFDRCLGLGVRWLLLWLP